MISFPVSSPAFCIDTITFYFSHYKFVLKFIVFLIYIFLIGSDVEYFSYAYFMFVYLMEYVFMYFAYFLIGLFVFKLLSFKNYLFVLNTNLLSDMWFSVNCLWFLTKIHFCMFVWVISGLSIGGVLPALFHWYICLLFLLDYCRYLLGLNVLYSDYSHFIFYLSFVLPIFCYVCLFM